MKKRVLILLVSFIYSFSYSQNFDINDFVKLDENKDNGLGIIKDAEALMKETGELDPNSRSMA
jgi:hypothetical protein